jgi:multiple antibiotic resistance protein
MDFFLLAFPALFSIINPLGGAFVFLGATGGCTLEMREHLARWVAIHSFFVLNASLYIGAYVLSFFGISIAALRVAGGIMIAVNGFRMLDQGDSQEKQETAVEAASRRDASRLAFVPLTLPVTTGPGTISVAVALGANKPHGLQFLWFSLAATATTLIMCALIFLLYRSADRVSKAVGPTGTTIIVRLSAFLLFCIGIQVAWSGLEELLAGMLSKARG